VSDRKGCGKPQFTVCWPEAHDGLQANMAPQSVGVRVAERPEQQGGSAALLKGLRRMLSCVVWFEGGNMRRWWMGLLGLPVIVAMLACGASPTNSSTASDTASGDSCPLVNAGPPPVCPEGCTWDGKECRKHSGIIMPDSTPDGGSPIPK
jgi:hypothetical protein